MPSRFTAARLALAPVLVAIGICAPPAESYAFPHVFDKGESVAQVAERMYGRVELERVVVTANRLDGRQGNDLVPGMRLEVPAVGYAKVLPGDTWKSLAAVSLGGHERGDVLAMLNDAKPWIRPATGREIILPYNLRIVAEPGDTTQSVAYRYLGHRDKAWVVAMYNGLKRARLRQGEVLLVPLMDLKLTAAGKRAARTAGELVASEGEGSALEAQAAARRALPELAQHIRRGRYIQAVAVASHLLGVADGAGLSDPQLAEVHRHLTEAYVALGAKALAAKACTAWRKHDPSAELDPVMVSPKILTACVGGATGQDGAGAGDGR